MRTTMKMAALAIAACVAAMAPFRAPPERDMASGFPGWPTEIDGAALTALPLSARELAFGRDFPGRIGRFTDGRREIILRWVAAPTRKLHPAADCLRGAGYQITPRPGARDAQGRVMACLRATKGGETIAVCERIDGPDGRSWPDASSWYWAALWGQTTGSDTGSTGADADASSQHFEATRPRTAHPQVDRPQADRPQTAGGPWWAYTFAQIE